MHIDLTKDTFDKVVLMSDKPVFIDFFSIDCDSCQLLSPIMEELSNEFKEIVTFAKIDYHKNQEIAHRYGVVSIPTVCIFKNGQVAASASNIRPEAYYEKMLDQVLLGH